MTGSLGWHVSLCGSSVTGTWREGSLAGDPLGHVEKRLWKRASPSIRAPFGEPGEGLIYGGIFEMVKGALRMRRLSP